MAAALKVTSKDFAAGERIGKRHAYAPEGENVPPAIAWTGAPPGTKEFALICDDPDAPVQEPWVHWVLYRIPGTSTGLPDGLRGAAAGRNSWNQTGWGGPLPPPGHGTHHYHFKVYALDSSLGLPAGASKRDLLKSMKGHVLAEGEVMGTYSRPA
jgi:Raf kinase inhibitor-like YbhB/YbcL family protein